MSSFVLLFLKQSEHHEDCLYKILIDASARLHR